MKNKFRYGDKSYFVFLSQKLAGQVSFFLYEPKALVS